MKTVTRLFKNFQPTEYDLRITPDMQQMAFEGTVTIRGRKVGRPSQRLTFHQRGLTITGATIIRREKKGNRDLSVSRINNQNTLTEVRLHTNEMLCGGDYTVTMQFKGKITRGMTGLYPCFFTVGSKEHVMLATQFESHHARELFPCIDEPEAKATFNLTLVTPRDLTVLSNTPVKNEEDIDQARSPLVATTFETTPKMSTYLLAFVIGELQSKTAQTNRGTEVSIWATIAQPPSSLDFALEAAIGSVQFFEEYFGVPYPLPKLDHVALPDFSSGAMENWGLITYRERALLAYPDETSQSLKEYIAMVIAHETSHQWFGNLVTMRWWNDLWLNESFANMMEYQAVNALYPEWHVWDTFIVSEGLSSLRRDAVPGVQAVKTTVRHPDEINTLFDPSIVYAKGGRLLYMLKKYLGEETFRRGLTDYFKTHAYSNTTGDDLWKALGKASGQDIENFMQPWLERSGFPVVTVDSVGDTLELKQQHFLENGDPSDGRIWPVPLFANDPQLPKLFSAAEHTYPTKSQGPLLINQGFAGHYIVQYLNQAHRKQIVKLVSDAALSIPDRLMLLNDSLMLSKAAFEHFAGVLHLLEAYQNESAEAVWNIISLVIAETRRFIDLDDSLESPIKAFIRSLIQQEYRRLGWQEKANESAADQKQRATILGLGSYSEEPQIIAESERRFDAYRQHGEKIDPEIRVVIFVTAIRNKLPGAFDYLLNLHDSTSNSDLKAEAMGALTATQDDSEAQRLLNRLTDARLIKPQDADHWLASLLRNRYVRKLAWDWMESHWAWIKQTYANDKSYDNFPRYAAGGCNTREWLDRYSTFFAPKRDEIALERNIILGISEIETRVKWLERDVASVRGFFKKEASR